MTNILDSRLCQVLVLYFNLCFGESGFLASLGYVAVWVMVSVGYVSVLVTASLGYVKV